MKRRLAAVTTIATLSALSMSGTAMAATKAKPKAKPATQVAKDTDRDGMTDAYEKANGLNAKKKDAGGDKDADGLKNLAEFKAGTSAAKADTDGDTLPDGYEVTKKLNPKRNDAKSDPDADGLINKTERMLGLNPRVADTDGDGVSDGDEDADGDGVVNSKDVKPKVYDRPAAKATATVTTFDAATGALTVAYPKGRSMTVTVTEATEIAWHGKAAECPTPATVADLTPGRGVQSVEAEEQVAEEIKLICAPATAPATEPAPVGA
ncbi:hypothetical protein Ade02nite_03460 [Paractinoplanes deccanensis]|uniref:Uncharacterized protein n=1 Tax=Paractinoplanes deccanensis TaxID=113561 RepID=A0ABQ3XVG2_9ACTN|nr:hypothetical protein [Actinoplanes deccanensis]GID71705.1 hypothetical protein Ade02nite_03460 [Actinoplanes deccanensis]